MNQSKNQSSNQIRELWNKTLLEEQGLSLNNFGNEQDFLQSRNKQKEDFHNHDGINSNKVDFSDLIGYVKTETSTTQITTSKPRFASEQIKLYVDSLSSPSTKRLYIYSPECTSASRWFYVNLT